jgi:predicted acyl esterase
MAVEPGGHVYASRFRHRAVLTGATAVVILSGGIAVGAPRPQSATDELLLCSGNTVDRFARVKPGPYKAGPRRVMDLESELDGVRIQIGVLRPLVPKEMKVPVIAFASPYFYEDLHDADLRRCAPRLSENFISHGYAIAFVATRGSAGSGGCSDLMGQAERADLDQAITWLGKQPWSNGSVGMIGVSYDGSTPWEVAGEGNPYLKTIVPISGVNDIYDLMFGSGVVEFRGPILLNALYYSDGFGPQSGRNESDWLPGAICPTAWEGFVASIESAITGARDHLDYWSERNSRPRVEKKYRGSIFLVQGLQDWNVDPGHQYPWVWKLEKKGFYVKHLLGQWHHAWPDSTSLQPPIARYDWADILLRWFDHYLKDKSVNTGPRVQVQDSSGDWRNATAWPPRDARSLKLHLGADMTLSASAREETSSILLTPDPSRSTVNYLAGYYPEACLGCAEFSTEPMKAELRFAGRPRLRLQVTPTGPGGHVSAWLYAVSGGTRERIGWGQADLRFPTGGESPSAVTPGQALELTIDLQPLDAVVERGARLVMVVSQGAHADHIPTPASFPVVMTAGDGLSVLKLETFEVGRRAFFTPPTRPRLPAAP